MKLGIEKKLTVNFVLSILFVCIMGFWFIHVNSKEDKKNARIFNSRLSLTLLEATTSDQFQALELFNDYIITRDIEKIREIDFLNEKQLSNIISLKKLLEDEPESLRNLALLKNGIDKSFSYYNSIYSQIGKEAFTAQLALQIIAKAKNNTNQIHRTVENIISSENTTVNKLSSEVQGLKLTNTIIMFTGISSAIIFLFVFYRSTRKEIAIKMKSEYDLRILGKAIKCINESVVITDFGNKILFINEAFKRTYNYTEEEMIGRDISFIYSKRIPQHRLEEIFDYLILDGWAGEIIHNTKDGSELIVQVSGSPVKNEDGNTIAVVSVISDITERMKTQEEVERYIEELQVNQDLLEQNAEELLELNVKLYESEQQLKELNENKDKFFSIISHDLRSPFSSLIGLADILVNDINNLSKDEISYFSQNIYNTSKGVLNLVDRLLQWSRLQTGRIDYAPKSISLFKTVNDISGVLKGNLIKKNIVMHNEIRENTMIYADENMITSIIQNLISNALKFTDENGKIVIADKDDADFVEVSIIDNGIGMSEERTKKLFNIESNLTTPGTAHESGSGLGLILCKELVEKNNGKIWVKSIVGSGTTFIFTVPKAAVLQDQV